MAKDLAAGDDARRIIKKREELGLRRRRELLASTQACEAIGNAFPHGNDPGLLHAANS